MSAVDAILATWAARFGLTPAELDVLRLAARGTPRSRIHEVRGVSPSTLKTQVQTLLRRTGDTSLDGAVCRLLREALSSRTAA